MAPGLFPVDNQGGRAHNTCYAKSGEKGKYHPLSLSFRPDIARIDIIGMRNRLVHGYFTVDYNVVWDTAATYIPVLLEQLKRVKGGNE
jgi:uncharacterized protein with HEPN domain